MTGAAAGGDSGDEAMTRGYGVRFFRGLMFALPFAIGLWMLAGYALSTDLSHCGPDAFSPPAPPEICNQVHRIPEPDSLILVAIGLLALRRKHGE